MITRFKITLLILSTICIFLLITACSKMFVHEDNNPTVAWEQFCEYLSQGDYRAAIEMTGNSIEVTSDDFDDSVEGLMLTTITESIDTDVIMEPRINGTGAWQSVKITHIDMDLLMQKVLSGVKTRNVYWFAYASIGLMAGLAGILTAARAKGIDPVYGEGYEMDAIASCFIGGASAYGGIGKVSGMIVGAVLMGVINQGMNMVGIDSNLQKVVKGLVLLGAVVFDVLSKRQKR